MKFSFVIFFTLISCNTFSQQKKLKFTSINTIGVIHGNAGEFANLQSINGVSKNKYFAGIGLGVDWYKYKSVTATAEVRNYLLKEKNFGVNAGIGYNFPFNNKPDFNVVSTYYTPTFAGDLYTNAGLFYEFRFLKKYRGVINPGFTIKKMTLTTKDVSPCLVPPCPETVNKYHYNFQTLSIKTGVIF